MIIYVITNAAKGDRKLNESQIKSDLSEQIAENFGANANYVESMLNRYRSDPAQVDESWRVYFAELLGEPTPQLSSNTVNGRNAGVPIASQSPPTIAREPIKNGGATMTATARPSKQIPAAASEQLASNPIRGSALKIVENMEESLTVPTATSQRPIPVKVLEENRSIINAHRLKNHQGKVSFTHLVAWAIIQALKKFPRLNDSFAVTENGAVRVHREEINLGLAIDITKKDGSHTLLVPNVKNAGALGFAEFLTGYDTVVKRAREGKLQISDFQDTTISLTNPGTLGTVASIPRLMAGQSMIIATGAIEYPAEYRAMALPTLSQLGISRTLTITNTYDHRIIQGAESGVFLAYINQLLLGEDKFYEDIFASIGIHYLPLRWAVDHNPALLGEAHLQEMTIKQARVLELINAYRVGGHQVADIDPLNATLATPIHHYDELDIENYGLTIWDLDREFITGGLGGVKSATLRDILSLLRRSYCGKVGIEYRHIQNTERKRWLQERIETEPTPVSVEIKKQILWKLISAEQFERFLHTKYLGQKRFSVEGCESIIPLLDQLIEGAAVRGTEDITIGMAHRGRLTILASVIGKFCERIFTAFEGSVHPNFPADEGDVKYHQGAIGFRETAEGRKVGLTVSSNPSHLEFVDPVVEGMVRAKQEIMQREKKVSREESWKHFLPVLLHGDAAFAGQGIVMETLNLADLKGYRTGGTIHIIVNNQIGFTTSPEYGRSSIYSTDIAKMTQLPIIHVNADAPEAIYRVLQLALDYRQKFNEDIVIDVVGFRRLGHNEGDEPSYTQPLMYARVKAHPGVRTIYSEQLINEGVIDEAEVNRLIKDRVERYEKSLAGAKEVAAKRPAPKDLPTPIQDEDGSGIIPTAISVELINRIGNLIAIVPTGFNVNPKMVGQLARRAKMGDGSLPIDWAFAEAVAFGSLVTEGTSVRLSGQDSGRGTFSQRHAVLYDTQTGLPWIPLAELKSETDPIAQFDVIDSSLSEQGVLGFEYGFSAIERSSLVMWEAQFGDFANGAQVIIDQFISSGEDKWQQPSRLVLLLPHGFEGQGPEHSSARLERFLQLCAENNMQVCNPTTPAQYFHLLRRQVKQSVMRPLIVMTPKSLLRLPAATSTREELADGAFQPVIDDLSLTSSDKANATAKVKRVVITSGKIFYDLDAARKKAAEDRVAILRLEQFYPFPAQALQTILSRYKFGTDIVWTQEEPQNMGGWTFVERRFNNLLGKNQRIRFVGRTPSASPASGTYSLHLLEQQRVVNESLQL